MKAFGGLIRNTIAVLLLVVLGLLVALALRSLAATPGGREAGGDETTGGSVGGDAGEQAPAGPRTSPPGEADGVDAQAADGATTVVLGDPESAASVTCFRTDDDPEGSFHVQVVDPVGVPERMAVAVALIGPSGEREERTVDLGQAGPGEPVAAPVDDSAGANRFLACTVTAVQRDRQVFLTGN